MKLKVTTESMEALRRAWRTYMEALRKQLAEVAAACLEEARAEACADLEKGTFAPQSVQDWLRAREADIAAWQQESDDTFDKKSRAALRMLTKLSKQEFGPVDLGYCYVADFSRNTVRCVGNGTPNAVTIGTLGVTYQCSYAGHTCSLQFDPPALRLGEWQR